METEQDKVLEALQIAIAMENDGRECYLMASEGSGNVVGRTLLELLAAEEEAHRQVFQQIYEDIRSNKGWPKTDFRPNAGKKLRAVFAQTCEATGVNINGVSSDFDAIKAVLDKLDKSHDFYERQSMCATYEAERTFYKTMAAEEREHGIIVLDYYEYLTDPAGWFANKEHSSLDGG